MFLLMLLDNYIVKAWRPMPSTWVSTSASGTGPVGAAAEASLVGWVAGWLAGWPECIKIPCGETTGSQKGAKREPNGNQKRQTWNKKDAKMRQGTSQKSLCGTGARRWGIQCQKGTTSLHLSEAFCSKIHDKRYRQFFWKSITKMYGKVC